MANGTLNIVKEREDLAFLKVVSILHVIDRVLHGHDLTMGA